MKRIETPALLVRSVPYGEADLVVTLFTEADGKLSAIVRGARRSAKRFGGALEPIHELVVSLEDRGKELCVLKEARIGRARLGVTADLTAMEAAGTALRWVRHLCPARTPEPAVWRGLAELLDLLDGRAEVGASRAPALVVFGLRLLADVGYALDLERCTRCGRACPEGSAAQVDAAGGGLVCRSCGGARRTISGELRAAALRALAGEGGGLDEGQARDLLTLVEDAMAAHAGFDPHKAPR